MAQQQIAASTFDRNPQPKPAALLRFFVALTMLAAVTMAYGQTLTVLHEFGDVPGDGANPYAGLTMDAQGNLYGTTAGGGNVGGPCGNGCGNVFKLKRVGNSFLYSSLYSFVGGNDGASPETALTIGPNGSLYGTTLYGGGSNDYGTVFNVQPPPSYCKAVSCPWHETVLLGFNGVYGDSPYGQLVFDRAGNIYGTTWFGGAYNEGEIYELTPSGGAWSENTIHSFGTGNGGYQPISGLIFDSVGNLYGTTTWGGTGGYGLVYKLTSDGESWAQTTLYNFNGISVGGRPQANLLMDSSGNLYGTTGWVPETNNPGTVYELSPSGGGWTYTLLYTFPTGYEGAGNVSNLVMDRNGNLYGATSFEGNNDLCYYGCGTVFELSPSGGGWTYTDLYNFTGGSDGAWPFGGVVLDSAGNLYGTSETGGTGTGCLNGAGTCGVVWELTP